MRDSVVFYRSFVEAIEDLPPDDFKAAVMGILVYALDDEEPEVSGAAKTFFKMAKPLIDANNKKYQNGLKGGRPKTKNKPKENQNETKAEPYVDEDVDVNVKYKNNMRDANEMFERLWKAYPNKKGKGKVSDTQKKRLLAIGEPALVKAIERYSAELQKDADWRMPQNGSTFFNSGYVDYLDENFVPSDNQAKKTSKFETHGYNMDELSRMLLGL